MTLLDSNTKRTRFEWVEVEKSGKTSYVLVQRPGKRVLFVTTTKPLPAVCGAIDKAMIGRRELWMRCGYEPGHEGAHHDPKRPMHYWTETFFWDEIFEHLEEVSKARKVRVCQHCHKRKCDCKMERMADTRTGQRDFVREAHWDRVWNNLGIHRTEI